MNESDTMAKMGRPQIEINQQSFESLCSIQCTLVEIASFFKCSEDTIERWCRRTYRDENDCPMTFAEVYKNFSVGGKISLRRFQFKLAEHNTSMAIWLGKQWLGQRDNMDMSVEAKESGEVAALDEYFRRRNENGTA